MERNTIFNITIQNKRFSSTLLKKKLGKLKWGGGSSSLGKGREGREERNLELEIDKLLYTKKPLKPPPRRKKSAMYTVRQLGMG